MIDPQSFKNAMKLFASGVTVITWQDEENIQGVTVSAFNSLSLDPPLVLFCISKGAYIHPHLSKREHVVINILSAEQTNLAYQFAGAKRDGLESHLIYDNHYQEPMLDNAQANILVRINNIIEQGDHDIFIAEVLETKLNPDLSPLLYHNGQIFN